jgi:hypothetical protein
VPLHSQPGTVGRMPDLNSPESVNEWLQANGGVEGLRKAIDTGRFANRNKTDAEAWLRSHDREQQARTEQADRALSERSVLAAVATNRGHTTNRQLIGN